MDAALYEKLLEELRSDLTRTAPVLEELQSVESFLKRRLSTADDKSSYEKVLDDISADISHRHQSVAELQRVDRYVSRKLGKPSFDLNLAPAPERPQPESEAKKPADKKPVEPKGEKKSAAKKPKDEGGPDKAPGKHLSEMPGASSGNTIEFGPDGFPIARGEKAPVSEGSGMGGATINFGPDGFPVDSPKPDSQSKKK